MDEALQAMAGMAGKDRECGKYAIQSPPSSIQSLLLASRSPHVIE